VSSPSSSVSGSLAKKRPRVAYIEAHEATSLISAKHLGVRVEMNIKMLARRDDQFILKLQGLQCAACQKHFSKSFLSKKPYHYCRYTGKFSHCEIRNCFDITVALVVIHHKRFQCVGVNHSVGHSRDEISGRR
jgi:hypothetical protein